MKQRLGLAIIVAVVAPYAAACGGDDTARSRAGSEVATAPADSGPTATVGGAAAPLLGEWGEPHGSFVVRFRPDETFSIDNDGTLEDGSYVWGTYTVEGSKVRFVAHEASPCRGHEWDWETSLGANARLEAELLDDACQAIAGTRWSLVKR